MLHPRRHAATEQNYRLAFAEAPAAIAVVGAEGRERGLILEANRALHELVGRVEGSLLLRRVDDFADATDVSTIARDLADAALERSYPCELRLVLAGGRPCWVSVTVAPVRSAAGQPVRYVCHVEDVTARREAEHTMLDALQKQSLATAQLRELAQARSALVSTVSHDVRTPLATISAYVQLLAAGDAGPLSADQREMLDVIAQNVARADTITADLLALGEFEHAAVTEASVPVAIDDVLRGAVASIERLAAGRGQALSVDSELAGTNVAGHPGQLDRVLTNLLTNAVKFTPEGGAITVRGRVRDREIAIEITDTGAGIPPAEQDRIFQRFYRSDTARRPGVAGTGLGLAIAREIAGLHDGSIDVISKPGRGSTFTLRLPVLVDAITP